jgi:uncharacterized membrane protein YdbT with pleckstrin-like domain
VPESVLYESHPSVFRSRPFSYIFVCVLSLVGIGLIIHLYWWLKRKATKLTVTDQRTSLRRGLLSRHITEVYHSDVRNIELRQTLLQRIFRVGTIGVSSAGQAGMEIFVKGMPYPDKIKEIIDKYRRADDGE